MDSIIKTYDWYDLFNNEDIIFPDIQRIVDLNKVNQIIEFQKNNFIKYNSYKYFGVITICIYENKKYLIDGQHRYLSMKKLYEEYKKNFKCNIEIITVNNIDEINDYYDIINKNTPLPDFKFSNNTDKNIIEDVCNYFQLKYNDIWSKTHRARRPHIYFNYFQESIIFIKTKLNIESKDKLIHIIEEKNNHIITYQKINLKILMIICYKKLKIIIFIYYLHKI